MPNTLYDVIVVGTGAGGGTAMKILCEAGLKVCALNSGPRTDPDQDYRNHRQVYDLKYRGYSEPLRFKDKDRQEPYSVEESEYSDGRGLFEHDVAYSNAPGTDWYWKRCKATGGKANFTPASSQAAPTRPPPCRSWPSPCALAITCSKTSREMFTSAPEFALDARRGLAQFHFRARLF